MIPVDPAYCQRKILDMHGDYGAQWLAQLPGRVAECAARWSLQVLPPFPVESYSYVAPAVRAGGEPAVLKVGVPDEELDCQIEALRLWDGRGACRLLEADAARGCLLMERVLPGDPLKALAAGDEEITRVAVETMQRLWRPAPAAPHAFPSVAGWASALDKLRLRFGGGAGPFPAGPIRRAERQFAELLADGASLLIHGDMNWGNILRAGREPWLVIDPKGVVGDPLYDAATFLNDPPEGLSEPELRRLLARRVAQIARMLCVEPERVRLWAQAHCILAGVWTYGDPPGPAWKRVFAQAELYDRIA
jgi:streptomycin 6-kinase